jgi:YVTN family beta-propeller protein
VFGEQHKEMSVVEFRILGPLEVVRDGNVVPLRRPRLRALLAVLLLHANQVVSTDTLIDALWGETPPRNAVNALQTAVSRLRKQLLDGDDGAGELIRTRPRGYVIEVGPNDLDLARFERLVRHGQDELRGGRPEAAAHILREALATWRGRALADLTPEGFLQREAGRLEEERIAALELRIDADLACGRHAALVGELEAIVAQHPFRERLRGQLMVALYRSGRQAEALAVYRNCRSLLANELGIEPSRALQGLERSILLHDADLELTVDADAPVDADPEVALARTAEPSLISRRRLHLVVGAALLMTAVAVSGAAIAVREDGGPAALARLAPNALGAIDAETNRLTGQARVGRRPIRVAVGENAVWVLNADDRTVSRVVPGSRQVTRTIPIRRTAEPAGLATGDGSVWLGTGLQGPLVLSRIDPSFNEEVQAVSLGRADEPFFAARWQVAVGEGSIWTVGGGFGNVLRIDPRTLNVVSRINTGIQPTTIAVGEGAVWAGGSRNVVVRIDAHTNEVAGEWRVPLGPLAIAAGAGAVWVTAAREDVVARIDAATETVTTIRVGDLPTAVAIGHGSVWVANAGDGTVSRVDPKTRRVTATIRLGVSPEAIAVGEGVVWVTASTGLEQR